MQAMAPARRVKDARVATAAMKPRKKGAVGLECVSGSLAQPSNHDYCRLAQQQYQSEGQIEIDPHAKVSRSEDATGEIGAWVQGWVFVYKPERG